MFVFDGEVSNIFGSLASCSLTTAEAIEIQVVFRLGRLSSQIKGSSRPFDLFSFFLTRARSPESRVLTKDRGSHVWRHRKMVAEKQGRGESKCGLRETCLCGLGMLGEPPSTCARTGAPHPFFAGEKSRSPAGSKFKADTIRGSRLQSPFCAPLRMKPGGKLYTPPPACPKRSAAQQRAAGSRPLTLGPRKTLWIGHLPTPLKNVPLTPRFQVPLLGKGL